MKKHIKPVLLFALIIGLSACSSEPVLEIEKFQDNWYKDIGTTHENKYRLDKHIYMYFAYDKANYLNDNPMSAGCSIDARTIETTANFTSVDNTLAYLNQVDTRRHPEWVISADGKNKYDLSDGQLIKSIWFKRSELPDDIFNPLNVNLAEFYADSENLVTESPVKTAYDECLQFFYDGADKQTYTKKNSSLTFVEKYREGFERKYHKSDFEEVLKSKNTLVRMYAACSGASFYFIDINRMLFVTISAGVKETFPNPACK